MWEKIGDIRRMVCFWFCVVDGVACECVFGFVVCFCVILLCVCCLIRL